MPRSTSNRSGNTNVPNKLKTGDFKENRRFYFIGILARQKIIAFFTSWFAPIAAVQRTFLCFFDHYKLLYDDLGSVVRYPYLDIVCELSNYRPLQFVQLL